MSNPTPCQALTVLTTSYLDPRTLTEFSRFACAGCGAPYRACGDLLRAARLTR